MRRHDGDNPRHRGASGSRIERRRFGAGFSSALAMALAVAVFTAANALSFRLWARWSFTPEASLSDSTVEALERVPGRLELIAAFERGHPLRDSMRGLLAACQDAARSAPWIDLDVEMVDINHDPAAAAALLRRESMPANSLLVRTAGRGTTLDEFDLAGDGTLPAPDACESALVSAILSLLRPSDATVGFLVGRGEYDPDDQHPVTGASLASRALQKAGWHVRGLSIAGGNRIPAWCDVLVDAGPRSVYSAAEAEAMSSWLAGGGRLLLLLDDPYAAGLAPALATWGVRLEPPPEKTGAFLSEPTTAWAEHPAAGRATGTAPRWTSPCTVVTSGPDAAPIAYIGATDGSGGESAPALRCVAAAVELERPDGSTRSPRLIVAGDSDAFGNGRLSTAAGSANEQLLVSFVDWLGASDAASFVPHGIQQESGNASGDNANGERDNTTSGRVRLSHAAASPLALCLVWPLAILAFGFFVWIPASRL